MSTGRPVTWQCERVVGAVIVGEHMIGVNGYGGDRLVSGPLHFAFGFPCFDGEAETGFITVGEFHFDGGGKD